MMAADGPDLWLAEPDGVLAKEAGNFRLVVRLVNGAARFLVLQRPEPAGMLPPTIVASGTEDNLRDAMAAAGRMAARLAAGTERFNAALRNPASAGVPALSEDRSGEDYASASASADAGWCEEWEPICRPTISGDETYGDFLRAIEKGHHEPALMDHLAKCHATLPDLHRRILGLAEHATCADAVRVLRAA